jgi:YgiT-type zinc finger domain-containing protein
MTRLKKNRCPVCGGKRKHGKTTFTAEFGTGVVVIRNVPATVCTQCGEDWIADDIAERLEGIVAPFAVKKNGVVYLRFLDDPKKAEPYIYRWDKDKFSKATLP